MKIKITRIDKDLPLPEYKTEGAIGCDLYARETVVVKPKTVGKVPTNVVVGTPKGYMCMLVSRSSTPLRKGLMPANGFGAGDPDFCGPEDEYQYLAYNITDEPVTVQRGERIAQLIFVKVERAEWQEANVIGKTRGGLGSTGTD